MIDVSVALRPSEGHQHGVSMQHVQSSINLGETLLRIKRE